MRFGHPDLEGLTHDTAIQHRVSLLYMPATKEVASKSDLSKIDDWLEMNSL